MRRSCVLIGFILAVFTAGALISPWIYFAVKALADRSPTMAELAGKPFPRFVGRTLLVLAIAGLWPLLKFLQLSVRDLGVTKPDWENLCRGALLGFAMLGVLIALEWWLGARTTRTETTASEIFTAALTALGAGVAVAMLEELIFRGAIFGMMRSENGWIAALIFSSVIFALVHFLRSPRGAGDVQWSSGFQVLGQMFAVGSQPLTRAAQFVNFTLCGVLLAVAYQRSGNLWFSIGLHGGWIFWLKLGNQITRVSPDAPQWLWGTRRVIDGWSTTVLLLAALAALPWLTRKSSSAG